MSEQMKPSDFRVEHETEKARLLEQVSTGDKYWVPKWVWDEFQKGNQKATGILAEKVAKGDKAVDRYAKARQTEEESRAYAAKEVPARDDEEDPF